MKTCFTRVFVYFDNPSNIPGHAPTGLNNTSLCLSNMTVGKAAGGVVWLLLGHWYQQPSKFTADSETHRLMDFNFLWLYQY